MSQPNWKLPLALAAALAVLGPTLYWLEYSHRPQREEKEEQAKHLFQLKDQPVESMALRTPVGTYEFKCADLEQKLCKPGDNSKWELESPARLRADDSSVNGLLSALNNLTPIETIDLADESEEKRKALLAEYQLDEASRRDPAKANLVELRLPGGQLRKVYFGATHPISDGLFAAPFEGEGGGEKLSGTKIQVVPSYFGGNFAKDLTYWRHKRILALNASQVKRLELKGTQGRVAAEKRDGKWILPGDLPGDIENIDGLLTAATFLTARSFAAEKQGTPEARKALAGASPVVTLTLVPEKEEEKVVLTLYRKGKGEDAPAFATATGRDPVYELDGSAQTRLDKGLKELRLQKLITSMDRFGTRKIEVSGTPVGEKPLVVEKKDGKWAPAEGGDINPERPQQLLDRLSGNLIRDFLTGGAIPAGEKDGIRISLHDEKGERTRQLAFWKAKEKGVESLFARDLLSPRNEAFRVDTPLKDALPWARDFFAQSDAVGGAPADAGMPAGGRGHFDEHGHGHEH
jgi:hypothetical protein